MSREPFEAMPDVMDAKQLAEALQISKAGAYNLLSIRLILAGKSHEHIAIRKMLTFLVEIRGNK